MNDASIQSDNGSGAIGTGGYFRLLALFAFVVLFGGLFFRELWHGDEVRVAGISAEMLLHGTWMKPTLLGTPFLEYPPLAYWLQACSFRVFGFHDFAAKLPSVLAAFGTVLLAFKMARELRFSAFAAFCAGMILCTAGQFFEESRDARVDMMFTFGIALALTGYVQWRMRKECAGKFYGMGIMAAGIAFAVMIKGPTALALIGTAAGAEFLASGLILRRWRWSYWFDGAMVLLCGLLPVAIWGAWLYKEDPEAFQTVFVHNSLGRFSGAHSDHAAPWYDYLTMLPGMFWPWLPLLPFALYGAFLHFRRSVRQRLLLCFLLAPFLILCAASAKRQVYLMPLFAPAALLCALTLERFLAGKFRWSIPARFMPDRRKAVYLLAALALLYIGVDAAMGLIQNNKKSLRPVFAEAKQRADANSGVIRMGISWERILGAAAYYVHPIPARLASPDEFKTGDVVVVPFDKKPLPPGVELTRCGFKIALLSGDRAGCVAWLKNGRQEKE